jgi:glycosidase
VLIPKLDLRNLGVVLDDFIKDKKVPAERASFPWQLILTSDPETGKTTIKVGDVGEKDINQLKYQNTEPTGSVFNFTHNIEEVTAAFVKEVEALFNN